MRLAKAIGNTEKEAPSVKTAARVTHMPGALFETVNGRGLIEIWMTLGRGLNLGAYFGGYPYSYRNEWVYYRVAAGRGLQWEHFCAEPESTLSAQDQMALEKTPEEIIEWGRANEYVRQRIRADVTRDRLVHGPVPRPGQGPEKTAPATYKAQWRQLEDLPVGSIYVDTYADVTYLNARIEDNRVIFRALDQGENRQEYVEELLEIGPQLAEDFWTGAFTGWHTMTWNQALIQGDNELSTLHDVVREGWGDEPEVATYKAEELLPYREVSIDEVPVGGFFVEVYGTTGVIIPGYRAGSDAFTAYGDVLTPAGTIPDETLEDGVRWLAVPGNRAILKQDTDVYHLADYDMGSAYYLVDVEGPAAAQATYKAQQLEDTPQWQELQPTGTSQRYIILMRSPRNYLYLGILRDDTVYFRDRAFTSVLEARQWLMASGYRQFQQYGTKGLSVWVLGDMTQDPDVYHYVILGDLDGGPDTTYKAEAPPLDYQEVPNAEDIPVDAFFVYTTKHYAYPGYRESPHLCRVYASPLFDLGVEETVEHAIRWLQDPKNREELRNLARGVLWDDIADRENIRLYRVGGLSEVAPAAYKAGGNPDLPAYHQVQPGAVPAGSFGVWIAGDFATPFYLDTDGVTLYYYVGDLPDAGVSYAESIEDGLLWLRDPANRDSLRHHTRSTCVESTAIAAFMASEAAKEEDNRCGWYIADVGAVDTPSTYKAEDLRKMLSPQVETPPVGAMVVLYTPTGPVRGRFMGDQTLLSPLEAGPDGQFEASDRSDLWVLETEAGFGTLLDVHGTKQPSWVALPRAGVYHCAAEDAPPEPGWVVLSRDLPLVVNAPYVLREVYSHSVHRNTYGAYYSATDSFVCWELTDLFEAEGPEAVLAEARRRMDAGDLGFVWAYDFDTAAKLHNIHVYGLGTENPEAMYKAQAGAIPSGFVRTQFLAALRNRRVGVTGVDLPEDNLQAAYVLSDWAVRVLAAAALEGMGRDEYAARLRILPFVGHATAAEQAATAAYEIGNGLLDEPLASLVQNCAYAARHTAWYSADNLMEITSAVADSVKHAVKLLTRPTVNAILARIGEHLAGGGTGQATYKAMKPRPLEAFRKHLLERGITCPEMEAPLDDIPMAYALADWALRVVAPEVLLRKERTADAETLRSLPPIQDKASALQAANTSKWLKETLGSETNYVAAYSTVSYGMSAAARAAEEADRYHPMSNPGRFAACAAKTAVTYLKKPRVEQMVADLLAGFGPAPVADATYKAGIDDGWVNQSVADLPVGATGLIRTHGAYTNIQWLFRIPEPGVLEFLPVDSANTTPEALFAASSWEGWDPSYSWTFKDASEENLTLYDVYLDGATAPEATYKAQEEGVQGWPFHKDFVMTPGVPYALVYRDGSKYGAYHAGEGKLAYYLPEGMCTSVTEVLQTTQARMADATPPEEYWKYSDASRFQTEGFTIYAEEAQAPEATYKAEDAA